MQNEADEKQLRELFEAWFRASEARDIEGSMAPIARDVVSYEHELPLQVRGVDGVREVCQRGFESAQGDFRWDIPDLQIVVRGDIAVTWGLNRMKSQNPSFESWSRGTRVFQKIDGQWKMIHQHVSFPLDPATGQARTDLRPER